MKSSMVEDMMKELIDLNMKKYTSSQYKLV